MVMCSVTEVSAFFGGFSQERGRSSPKRIKQEVIQNIQDVHRENITISPNVSVIIQQNHWVIFCPYSFTVVYENVLHIRTSEPHDDRYTHKYHMRSQTFGRPTPTLRRIVNPTGGNDTTK